MLQHGAGSAQLALGIEVEVGEPHAVALLRRLDEHAPPRIDDERMPVRSPSLTGIAERPPLSRRDHEGLVLDRPSS